MKSLKKKKKKQTKNRNRNKDSLRVNEKLDKLLTSCMTPQTVLPPSASLFITLNHLQIQDHSSSLLLNSSPLTDLAESVIGKNLNCCCSKDVYIDNIYVKSKKMDLRKIY